jgi:D-tagatose-1,6-bisphosphate aldolase subunit GatZ/KbaZ
MNYAEVIAAHKSGRTVGIYSVCSADPTVLRAALVQAREDGTATLIEATSNQVDQFGGYTGMTPAGFRDFVLGLADEVGLPRDRVVLGGDHLGPNRWRSEVPEAAMAKADDLVRAYAEAGYTKLHLDCTFSCVGDPYPITDDIVAERAVRLLKVAEEGAAVAGTSADVRYVIGTEVPVPGGHAEELGELSPTPKDAARTTLETHRAAIEAAGLGDVWPRISALVVQPAVEFDHVKVVDYRSEGTAELRTVLDDEPNLVFEAHSTDYQTPDALAQLVEDHWAVLKVGPGLTFALREGLFGLAHIEDELVAEGRSDLRDVVEQRMVAEPAQWASYYAGSAEEQRLARRYSYSDRMRYYWPDEVIRASRERLVANLSAREIPLPLLSQYLPAQYERVRSGQLEATPEALLIDHVRDAIRPYAAACHGRA